MKRLLLALLCVVPAIVPAFGQTAPPPPDDLKTPPSTEALPMKVLSPGTGSQHPGADDFIHVRYAVWKESNGTVVDYTRTSTPAFVQISKLLPGMLQMFEAMTPGERRRAWISPDLGAGKIAAGETFVVDGELVDIVPPPTTPSDVAAPPADAVTTKSGLAYKILQAGSGTVHPRRSSTVRVIYTGWTTDGHMFDSSIVSGEPAEFSLNAVVAGWTEGLQLMTAGEKARFWIPGNLAYKNEPGKPHGMLVFDIELVKIK
jgi:peptidylprolyl isomerase